MCFPNDLLIHFAGFARDGLRASFGDLEALHLFGREVAIVGWAFLHPLALCCVAVEVYADLCLSVRIADGQHVWRPVDERFDGFLFAVVIDVDGGMPVSGWVADGLLDDG